MPDGRPPSRRAAGRLRPRAARRAGSPVGSGDVLTYCAAMAALDPDRPARPLLGRAHDAGHPPRADPGLRPGVPPVLPRRGVDGCPSRCRSTLRPARAGRVGAAGPGDRAGRRRARRRGGQPRADGLRRRGADGTSRSPPARRTSWPRCAGSWRGSGSTPPRRAHPPHDRRAVPAAGRTCAARSARRCACTASRPSSSGAGAGCGCGRSILILDVSGSMSDYSRNLLQFAYSTQAGRDPGRGVLLRHPAHPDHPGAASAAGRTTPWTRRPGRSSTGRAAPGSATRSTRSSAAGGAAALSRGAIVVICSDGLDRGDPAVLAGAMERLVAAEPPDRVDEPAQGRRRRLPAEHARDDGRRARTSTCCCPGTTCAASRSSRRSCPSA